MTRDYTMADFHAEMQRRGIHDRPSPKLRPRKPAPTQDRNTHPENVMAKMTKIATSHGSSIVEIVPCGVHPLHYVKVLASGGRRGCPMCEMQIEDVCRSFSPAPAKPREHAPRITNDLTRIIGCTCGWQTPAHISESDTAFTEHLAIARIAEGSSQ